MDFLTFPKLWLGLVGLTQTPGGAAGVLHDLLLAIGSPEARMLFPWTWKAKRALYVPCSSSAGTRGPQASVLCTPRPPHRQYLVYKPFFLQKEFFTDSRRLLSSRAGKLLSSKLSISPWPRAPDLVLPPKDGVVGRIGTHQTTWPFLSSSTLSLSLDAPFSCLLASRPRLELEVEWRNSWLFYLRRCITRKETYPSPPMGRRPSRVKSAIRGCRLAHLSLSSWSTSCSDLG